MQSMTNALRVPRAITYTWLQGAPAAAWDGLWLKHCKHRAVSGCSKARGAAVGSEEPPSLSKLPLKLGVHLASFPQGGHT